MIVRINLLPHRELKRQRQKQAFFLMTGLSVVAGATLVLLVWSVLEGYIDNQQGRNKLVADENRRLDAQIVAILKEDLCHRLRHFADRLPLFGGATNDLVVDVRQVHHLEYFPPT